MAWRALTPTVAGANSYNNLWQKTRAAFAMIAKKYMQDYDWIVWVLPRCY